jgi:hypothetical protein
MDPKAPQIVIAENEVAAPVCRANRYMPSVDLFDVSYVQTAVTGRAHIPFRSRRLLDKHAMVKQPIKRRPGMWRRLSAP